MAKGIKITKDLSLPLEMVTQTITILAKRRAGKSYTMRRVVEQLLSEGQQVVLIDPKGDQWGIRSSADGKHPGFPVLILGGEHGDLPLEKNAGELVAKLVVEDRVNVLLDVSLFSKADVAVFMSIFLEQLYRLKTREEYRTPMMLIVDEADAIAPQKPQANEARMLGAIDDIVRRGGQRGLGCLLITQRSAVLNKNVLTQSQMLIVLRLIAPQDIAAMKAWIDVHGTEEQRRELMESIPSLPVGDAYFWSPGWPTDDGIFSRGHVLPIETFDSAATPKPGQKRVVPKNLADVNLKALEKQMAATIEKAKSEDPRELKKQIQTLTAQLNAKSQEKAQADPATLDRAIARAVDSALKEQARGYEANLAQARAALTKASTLFKKIQDLAGSSSLPDIVAKESVPVLPVVRATSVPVARSVAPVLSAPIESLGTLRPGARKILEALASRYPMKLTKSQVGLFTSFKPSGGSFSSYLSELRKGGMIAQEGDLMYATQEGIDFLGVITAAPATRAETIEMWRKAMRPGEVRILDALLAVEPDWVSKDDLSVQCGSSGGSFSSYLSVLRRNGLIDVSRDGVRISSTLSDL